MKNTKQYYGLINLRNTFFSEVGLGISANTLLLLFHIFTFLLQHRLKPTDLIIGLLALFHLGMLLIMGIIVTDVLVPQDFGDEIKCKSVIYLYRCLRGFSICATCLLSVLQAITLSPRSSFLAKFKHKSPHQSLCSLVLLWVFYMSLSAHFSISAVNNSTVNIHGLIIVTKSCVILPMNYFLRHLFSSLGIFRDVSFIGLMALSSGYMVTLLCRHKRQSQHLHSTSLSSTASPEQRATQTILLLLGFFVFMYCLDCMVSSSRIMQNNDPTRHYMQVMVGNGYATISPLLLISTERRLQNFLKSLRRSIVNV